MRNTLLRQLLKPKLVAIARTSALEDVRKALHSRRGFSLLEVLMATTIVASALAGLAQLVVMSANANASAKTATLATVLAAQKMEQLRSLAWAFDSFGLPLSDPRLAASPFDSLRTNSAGFCDFLDKNGQSLAEDTTPPPGAAYLRRWSIEPLRADPDNVLVLQVLVTQRFSRGIDRPINRRTPGDARIISIRTRKAM
jgi:prepilin-type N-terminal cleavage/methylation domain-containing protein